MTRIATFISLVLAGSGLAFTIVPDQSPWNIYLLSIGAEMARASLVFVNAEARQKRPGEYWAVLSGPIAVTILLQWGIWQYHEGIIAVLASAANWLVLYAEYSLSTASQDNEDYDDLLSQKGELRLENESLRKQLEMAQNGSKLLEGVKGRRLAVDGKKAIPCPSCGHLNVAASNKYAPSNCEQCNHDLSH